MGILHFTPFDLFTLTLLDGWKGAEMCKRKSELCVCLCVWCGALWGGGWRGVLV